VVPADEVSEQISLPDDFRTTFVHLGSWFVPEGGASGFHDVYASAGTAEHYRSNGEFPDGAVLVKELRSSQSANYTTGTNVRSATAAVKQWFVMVKDRKGRFVDNPLWGDGWGWGLFKPDDPGTNVASDYKADCIGCHIPAQANDYIYTHAYPTLSASD
jgi:hypothetical protein